MRTATKLTLKIVGFIKIFKIIYIPTSRPMLNLKILRLEPMTQNFGHFFLYVKSTTIIIIFCDFPRLISD